MVTVAAVKPVCICTVIELGLSNSVNSGTLEFTNLSLLQIRHLWRLLYKKTALAVFSEVGFSVGALTRWQRVTTERWVLQNAADGWRLDVTVPQSPLWVTSLGDLYV